MSKKYSVLILPHRGTRIRRFAVSKRSIFCLLSGGTALLGIGGWMLGNYLWQNHLLEIGQLKSRARAQQENFASAQEQSQEKFSALQDRNKDIRALLVNWKGLQEKVQASLPSKHRSSLNGHYAVEELESNLSLLHSELENLIASIPSTMPTNGHISSPVGMRRSPWTGKQEFHAGLDIPNRVGTSVYAPGNGVVESVSVGNGNGRMVVLDHGQGIVTKYAHLSKSFVKKGDRVRKGQKIAAVGNTGKSTNPHLHYEVRVNGIPIDPRRKLIKK